MLPKLKSWSWCQQLQTISSMTYNLIVPYIRSYVHLLKSSSNLTSNPEVNVVTLLPNHDVHKIKVFIFCSDTSPSSYASSLHALLALVHLVANLLLICFLHLHKINFGTFWFLASSQKLTIPTRQESIFSKWGRTMQNKDEIFLFFFFFGLFSLMTTKSPSHTRAGSNLKPLVFNPRNLADNQKVNMKFNWVIFLYFVRD